MRNEAEQRRDRNKQRRRDARRPAEGCVKFEYNVVIGGWPAGEREMFDRMGGQGWQLISINRRQALGPRHQYTFERRIESC